MQFECELDPKLFKSMTDAAATVVNEGNLMATPEGISMGAFDDGHIALVTFMIPSAACLSYSCDQEIQMGVVLADVNAVLKRASAKETLKLQLDSENASLVITFESPTKKIRRFSLKLIDTSGDAIPSLDIPFETKLAIHPDTFAEAVKDAAMVSDYIELVADEGVIVNAMADSKTRDVSVTIPASELRNYEKGEDSKCVYPLEQLDAFVRNVKNAEDLAIGFGTDSPLRLMFKMPANSQMIFLLAPRVDSDDYDDYDDDDE